MNNEARKDLKRDKFREQIRKRQIEDIFENKRRNKNTLNQMNSLHEINKSLLRKSLVKDGLLEEVQNNQLLQRLQLLLKQNFTLPNIQFVMSICSNVLGDSISLMQRQFIYHMCQKCVTSGISLISEAYYYKNLILYSYECMGITEQQQIQSEVLSRMLDILTISSQLKQREQIITEILQTFQYFFHRDTDHNICLLYKCERNRQLLTNLIKWSHQQILTQISIINAILDLYNEISTVPISLCKILPFDSALILIEFTKTVMNLEDKRYQTEDLVFKIWINLIGDLPTILSTQQVSSIVTELKEKIFQNDNQILLRLQLIKELLNRDDERFRHLLKDIIEAVFAITAYEHTSEGRILQLSVLIVKNAIFLQYDEGEEELMIFFKDRGGLKWLEEVNVRKNIEIERVLEEIQQMVDMVE